MPVPYRAVYEFLPTGILITDRSGAVQSANLTAQKMLGPLLERERLRCCDVLDCRRPGTPLAGHCITELALSREAVLPEVRVDITTRGASTLSVWVAAAPFGGAETAVILQLRAGVVGDRRRRTEPHWIGGQRLRIFALGRTRVESGEGPLAGSWLGHRPGQILKYLLANRGRAISSEELIEVFWPQGGKAAPTSVRQAVHSLRDHLEPERSGSGAFVASGSGGYELEQASVWIDAEDFEDSLRTGVAAHGDGEHETAATALTRAVGLYRGDFLSDEPYSEWALAERDRLRDLAGQALRLLTDVKRGQGDLEGATEQLHRLAELEPLDADVHRDLLGLLIERGRQPEAARRYDLLKHRYQKTFGEGPPFTLADL